LSDKFVRDKRSSLFCPAVGDEETKVFSRLCQQAMTASMIQAAELDDLPPPPPPPEMGADENPYHVSAVLHSPPALPPPSLLKTGQNGRAKKITFNDNVQVTMLKPFFFLCR
jgi:hypothetical protein